MVVNSWVCAELFVVSCTQLQEDEHAPILSCDENRETYATNRQALKGAYVIEHSSWTPDDAGLVLQ